MNRKVVTYIYNASLNEFCPGFKQHFEAMSVSPECLFFNTRIIFYKERCSRETSVPVWKILGSFLNRSLILNENFS